MWGGGVVVAAVGLHALVALASEEAPFDVKDDTEAFHGPGWASALLVGVVLMLVVFAVMLASRPGPCQAGASRYGGNACSSTRSWRSGSAVLLLFLLHAFGEKPKTSPGKPDSTPDTSVESVPEHGEHDPGPPWAALILGARSWPCSAPRPSPVGAWPVRRAGVRRGCRHGTAVAALTESLDVLDHPGDDRAVIVAAYAGTARRARRGRDAPSRPSEAPEEYVARVLLAWHVAHSHSQDLTALSR